MASPTVHTPAARPIIVGAGVIGANIAFQLCKLSQHNKHIQPPLVIERVAVATAASGKSGGFLAYDWQDGQATEQLGRTSFDMHKQLADDLDGVKRYGYRRVNTVGLGVEASSNRPKSKAKRDSHFLPSWVDSQHITSVSHLGSTKTTAQVHPRLFTEVLIEETQKMGGELLIGEVTDVEVEEDSSHHQTVKSVTVNGTKQYACSHLIIASGPWSSQFGAQYFPLLPAVTGSKATSIVLRWNEEQKSADESKSGGTEELPPVDASCLFLTYTDKRGKSTSPEIYPRPAVNGEKHGEIYCCTEGGSDPLPATAADIKPNQRYVTDLKDVAALTCSQLGTKYTVAKEQACFLPSAADGVPVIGAVPDTTNAYIASGHTCWGILNSPGTGLAIAELIATGKSTTTDISELSPERLVTKRMRQQRAQRTAGSKHHQASHTDKAKPVKERITHNPAEQSHIV